MKKFLAGSAIASIFTTNGELIAISNTQINDTINLSVESQEVRSGYGNALDYIYYHSTKLEGQLEDAQFNLDYIKHNLGAIENQVASVYKSVNVTMAASNTINATEMIGDYVWAYYDDKAYTFAATYSAGQITFSNTHSELNGRNVCIKYLTQESGAYVRNLTISSNFIPDVVSIVLEAQLFASESGAADSSRVGTVLFRIPKAQLSGAQEISLSASGVASTPLSYMALKADDATANACASASGVYGYITEILDGAGVTWYEGVSMLAIDAVDDTLTVSVGEYINTYAVNEDGGFIVRPRNNITYGYQAEGQGAIVWGTDAATYVGADGSIKGTVSTGDKVYVKVVDANGNDVTTIQGDAAVIAIAD